MPTFKHEQNKADERVFEDDMDAVAEHRKPDALEIAPEALTSAAAAALMRELGPRVGELKRMYVAPEVRGQGIGRALLARLEVEARALGLTRVVLETGTRQAEALALYRRAGFTEIAAYGEYTASAGTSVCMAKAL